MFNVEFFFYGTLIMTFGLSVGQAILAIVVGNLFYALLGWASLQGPETGTTAFMVSRAPFGQNGNRVVALFNWVTQVGFEIEGVYFVVATVILLFLHYGTTLGDPGEDRRDHRGGGGRSWSCRSSATRRSPRCSATSPMCSSSSSWSWPSSPSAGCT